MTRLARPLARALSAVLLAVPVTASLSVVGAVTGVAPAVGGCALAAGVHHAGLVVQYADGRSSSFICVAFPEDSLTGEQLLDRSGLHYATAPYGGYGDAVCQIENEPASYPSSCWTASSPYWALYVKRGGGGWGFASQGVSSLQIRDGDAEGFRYEAQSDYSPPPLPPSDLCPPPATPTPAPTVAPAPPPSAPAVGNPAPATSGGGTAASAPTGSPGAAASSSASPSQGAVLGASSVTGPGNPTSNGGTTALRGSGVSTAAPQPPPSPAGALAAAALAAMLLALLAVQGVRVRRRRGT